MKTEDIISRLESRHSMLQGQWATVIEFQRIDFLAVGAWPSTRFHVHGYEIKASRSDWLRELKDPAKSAEGMAKVDQWWLAAPAGVLKDRSELPDGWGYIEVSETGTTIRHHAPLLRAPLPKKSTAGKVSSDWGERAAFAGMARRVAYAEADRAALLALGDVMDLDPALAMAAIKTGRHTAFQKELKAARAGRRRSTNGSAKRKKRRATNTDQYVGW